MLTLTLSLRLILLFYQLYNLVNYLFCRVGQSQMLDVFT